MKSVCAAILAFCAVANVGCRCFSSGNNWDCVRGQQVWQPGTPGGIGCESCGDDWCDGCGRGGSMARGILVGLSSRTTSEHACSRTCDCGIESTDCGIESTGCSAEPTGCSAEPIGCGIESTGCSAEPIGCGIESTGSSAGQACAAGGCSGGCDGSGCHVCEGATRGSHGDGSGGGGSRFSIGDSHDNHLAPIVNGRHATSVMISDGGHAAAGRGAMGYGGGMSAATSTCPRCGGMLGAGGLRAGCRRCGMGLRMIAQESKARLSPQAMTHALMRGPHGQAILEKTASHCENGYCNRPAGPETGAVHYPYYTVRGPRDFLSKNPANIGP